MQQYLKIFLFSCLLFQAALAEGMLPDMMLPNMEESVPLTEEQQDKAPKINWQPVWQELEVHGAELPHQLESAQQVPIVIPVQASISVLEQHQKLRENIDNCAAPNGLGIQHLLKEAKALFPMQQIQAILLNAVADPQVQALRRLVTSPEFRSKSAALKRSPEFGAMRDYSCKVLHLDLKYYAEFLRAIFHPVLNFSELPELDDVRATSGGIQGLLMDIRDVLPVQALRDLYQGLLASDAALNESIAHMKSQENREIFLNLYKRPEYKEMHKLMADIGVPLDAMRELVGTAWGYQGQPLGDVMGVLI